MLCLACTAKLASNDDIGFLIFPNAVSKFVTCTSLSIPNKIPSTHPTQYWNSTWNYKPMETNSLPTPSLEKLCHSCKVTWASEFSCLNEEQVRMCKFFISTKSASCKTQVKPAVSARSSVPGTDCDRFKTGGLMLVVWCWWFAAAGLSKSAGTHIEQVCRHTHIIYIEQVCRHTHWASLQAHTYNIYWASLQAHTYNIYWASLQIQTRGTKL